MYGFKTTAFHRTVDITEYRDHLMKLQSLIQQIKVNRLFSFALTFTILIIFSVVCTFNINWVGYSGRIIPLIDWVISKPLMGIIGVIVTIMAIISAMGLLLLLDVTFVDIATVMPFLSLSEFFQGLINRLENLNLFFFF